MATTCPSCRAPIDADSRFCPSCGTSLAIEDVEATIDATPTTPGSATVASGGSVTRVGSRISSGSGSGSGDGRFPAGTVFAGRYRMIGALGKGGMGEVYLADDLTLGQPVALKFLPAELAADETRLARFHNEVRIARQISHPNVCRVYDIGASDGIHYLSMEYVDGEDLSSLLKRIGRFPQDKGVEIARQICAGVAAAHDKGVLHRDLKPANVMLDGDGKVRITDFGLAELAGNIEGAEVRAGTPAYMAPEQLKGETVTSKSDLYSLGLLLYEIFTGKQAFEAETLGELTNLRATGTVTNISRVVSEIDPATERIIQQCLESDPSERPASALAVSAALPGGDPLAAALAAGETPSPELLAATGMKSAIRPSIAWVMGGAIVALFIIFATMNGRARGPLMTLFEKSPPVLIENARSLLTAVGVDEEAGDVAHSFSVDPGAFREVAMQTGLRDWNEIAARKPTLYRFWYRESTGFMRSDDEDGIIGYNDPPLVQTGMRRVTLSPSGELIRYDAVASQVLPPDSAHTAVDWAPFFEAAGLPFDEFAPTEPQWSPPDYADELRAWTGHYPGTPDDSIRIEAAGYFGEPIHFQIIAPWTAPDRSGGSTPRSAFIAQILTVVLVLGALFGGAFVARKNLKLGRGDRRGAFQVFSFVLMLQLLAWILTANHSADPGQLLMGFTRVLGSALFFSSFLWLMYMALEPHVRRTSPRLIVPWSRLTTGRWRDPIVGRDVLVGALLALSVNLIDLAHMLLPPKFGVPGAVLPLAMNASYLLGQKWLIGSLASTVATALMNGLFFIFVPILFQAIFRVRVIALAIFILVLGVLFGLRGGSLPQVGILFGLMQAGVFTYVAMRFGLLAITMCVTFYFLIVSMPISLDFSTWYASSTFIVLTILGAIWAGGLRIALGGDAPRTLQS